MCECAICIISQERGLIVDISACCLGVGAGLKLLVTRSYFFIEYNLMFS